MEHNVNVSRRQRAPAAPSLAPSGTRLVRDAERLLGALSAEGAYAFPDPTVPDGLIVRGGGTGVSLGSGRFAVACGEALLAAGLAEHEAGRRTRIVIAAAGASWLRRAGAEGPAFLAQHLDLVAGQGGQEGAGGRAGSGAGIDTDTFRDASESPLAWMARRRNRDGTPLIDTACFEAGERLRRDIAFAGMLPRLTSDWGRLRVDGSGPRDPAASSDAMVGARRRVDRALEAVGSDLSGLLIDLCGFLKGLERIEQDRGWPARSAKVVARIALGRLAEHYGLEREAVGPERGRLRLWRASAEGGPRS